MAALSRESVLRWRHDTRQRLIAARLALTVAQRLAASDAIREHLEAESGDLSGLTVSAYWPLRGEPDLRPWLAALLARGVRCALPVVVARAAPLGFRAWHPDCRMEKGFWDIPVPAEGPFLSPDLLIAPVVGFDDRCYRLGYGGGYFDRTLAALERPYRVLGVGYASAALDTIHPLPHDIPLQAVVTDQGVHRPRPAGG